MKGRKKIKTTDFSTTLGPERQKRLADLAKAKESTKTDVVKNLIDRAWEDMQR